MADLNKDFWKRFLDFEIENELFNLTDDRGTFYWDILRYEVYPLILWRENDSIPKKYSFSSKVLRTFHMFYDFLRLSFSFSRKENLFYLASRNKFSKGFIDQNAKTVYDLFPEQRNITIESYKRSGEVKNSYFLPQHTYRKFPKKGGLTKLHILIDILRKEFGELNFDTHYLQKLLDNYYNDISFFSILLKRKKIKRVFLTQNGIQKGLIKAAQDLKIPVFEFQHGIVDIGHLAYNYPEIEYKEGQISQPDVILSLSHFWFQELNLPGVKICPIGNDYFYAPLEKIKNQKNKEHNDITIISSDVFGKELLDFITIPHITRLLEKTTIYFKLHPNQFHEKEYYQEKLKFLKNIQVITNELSVAELLQKSHTLVAIQSTAIYEALQAQKKVIILKRSSYKRQEHVFNHPNLHLVDNADDFTKALETIIDKKYEVRFFEPFDKESFLKLI